ncbi:MAG: hypothetical protein HOD92_02325 [Deltaproteobacteria bacterium]|jgi:hypothetical protein|nr:hypothetical protein [Deltaproteobacteria bacterium]MBT4527305.1 hypothetical protein [Deltaproteobacteria bacterium]
MIGIFKPFLLLSSDSASTTGTISELTQKDIVPHQRLREGAQIDTLDEALTPMP